MGAANARGEDTEDGVEERVMPCHWYRGGGCDGGGIMFVLSDGDKDKGRTLGATGIGDAEAIGVGSELGCAP